MSARLQMSVEEYLETTFEDGDRDYVDGEVIERHLGKKSHSFVQMAVLTYLNGHPRKLFALPEIRIQVGESRFRVADVAAWPNSKIGGEIPTVQPFLAVEILSPGESFVYMHDKVQDYLQAGVSHVWVMDPWKRAAIEYSQECPSGRTTEMLQSIYSDVAMNTSELWASLPME